MKFVLLEMLVYVRVGFVFRSTRTSYTMKNWLSCVRDLHRSCTIQVYGFK
jgi:hypothetical protein